MPVSPAWYSGDRGFKSRPRNLISRFLCPLRSVKAGDSLVHYSRPRPFTCFLVFHLAILLFRSMKVLYWKHPYFAFIQPTLNAPFFILQVTLFDWYSVAVWLSSATYSGSAISAVRLSTRQMVSSNCPNSCHGNAPVTNDSLFLKLPGGRPDNYSFKVLKYEDIESVANGTKNK